MNFDVRAAQWDDDPEKVRNAAEVAHALTAQTDLPDRPRTLELGAGTGLLARALADRIAPERLGPVTLADASPGMRAAAAQVIADAGLTGWDVVAWDAESGAMPSGPYDLVLAQLALHHMSRPAEVLAQAISRLAPGGHLAVAELDTDPQGDFHAQHADFHGHHGFERADVADWFCDLGLTDVVTDTATTITKPVDGDDRIFEVFLVSGRTPTADGRG